MQHNCVVVAGGSRARFFTLEEADYPGLQSGPNLCEINDLVNSEKTVHGVDQWSDTKSGRNRASNGAAHGYDDHRSQHEDEFERRFARDVAREASRLLSKNSARQLVVVAQKRILGFLRHELDALIKTGVDIKELAKDLSKLSALEVHEHLAREQLLPQRRSPTS